MLFVATFCCLSAAGQTTTDTMQDFPELIFRNPKLVTAARTAGKEGAIYRFSNVATGYDAKVILKKFSRPDIVMQNIDATVDPQTGQPLGWDKAFQPQFGIAGTVARNQEWHVDFQMIFVKAGTETVSKIDRFSATALDVDGDGLSIQEYVKMEKASSVVTSAFSYLGQPAGTLVAPSCTKCKKASLSTNCLKCNGAGIDPTDPKKKRKCNTCTGVGLVYKTCGHPWEGQDVTVKGPNDNFVSIDTAATSVMSTFVYNNKDTVNFTIGATSGNYASSAGVRLNAIWFKGFSLMPPPATSLLPVRLTSFSVLYEHRSVKLKWTNVSEENIRYYVVERSSDGKEYTSISTVYPHGNHNTVGTYTFKDDNVVSAGTLYYRLRVVETYQEAIYSTVRSVRLEEAGAQASVLVAYPNPVESQLHVQLPQAWAGKSVVLELYNSFGTRVQVQAQDYAGPSATFQVQHLPKGLYIVKAVSGKETIRQNIVK